MKRPSNPLCCWQKKQNIKYNQYALESREGSNQISFLIFFILFLCNFDLCQVKI